LIGQANGTVTDEQWWRLFQALDRADLAQDPRFQDLVGRTRHIDELYAALGEEMKKCTADEWAGRLDAADVPNARMNMLPDLISDAYL
jgi:crotonobetainyl-CoA:carnitine CoA-transferase CaiB-like acyl-CoA transferase